MLFVYFRGFPTTNVLKWTHLNPTRLLKEIKKMNVVFDFDTLEIYMKRAGITYGYQEKPCLNPEDSDCPQSAPNKETLLVSQSNIYVYKS